LPLKLKYIHQFKSNKNYFIHSQYCSCRLVVFIAGRLLAINHLTDLQYLPVCFLHIEGKNKASFLRLYKNG
jgi:hypothetical protein